VKKSTTKKAKAKSGPKPKPPAKKFFASLKDKRAKPKSHAKPVSPARKDSVAAPTRNGLRKPAVAPPAAPTAPAQLQQKGISQNGRQPAGNDSKPQKPQEKVAPMINKSAAPLPELPPQVKTYLTAKELKEFRSLLLAKRAELAGDVENLTSEALNRKSSGVNEQSSMPIHMADLGSDTWEQDFTLGLIANEQALVREIDDALARIADRTYGMCVATDKPISLERLRAKPWAKYCIEYARLREEGRAP
jgi:RNA polymerase-binding protein DksA